MNYIDKKFIDWQQIIEDSISLAKKINSDNINIKGIVCITRGGLVVSGILSNLLNIKQIDILCVSSYNNKDRTELNIMQEPILAKKTLGQGWIVLDELVDTGESIKYAKKILPKSKIYSLYTKRNDLIELDGFVKLYDKNSWIEFPWEITL